MFERFTERARKVVVSAQEEARFFGHDYIGTEHLLLGLLHEDEGVAAHVLGSLNVTLDKACEQVESVVGRGEEGIGDRVGQAPFTTRSKRALESASREALQLGHNYIGTEHILLGLVRESEGGAAHVLSNLGVDPDKVRREVVRMIGGRKETRPAAHPEVSEYARALRANLVRARVEGLLVHARCGTTDEERALPQALRVDLEYVYQAGEGDELDKTVDYGAVLRDVAELLEREEFQLLETGMRKVGAYVLEGFPEIWEVTVRITKLHVPVPRAISGVSVEAVFTR